MENFALILPAGAVTVPFIQIILFVFFLAIVPGSLSATLLSYFAGKKSSGKIKIDKQALAIKVFNYALYHLAMLLIWIYTWPQIYNDIHTGYNGPGLFPYLGMMVLWTVLGLFLIFAFRTLIGVKTYRPTIGAFVRLYIWNLFIMFIFRQLIYYYVTR